MADSPADRYLPTLERARDQGLAVAAPTSWIRGTANLLVARPCAQLRVAAIQTTFTRAFRRGTVIVNESHELTHVAGPLAPFELPLRREVVAIRGRAEWPAALRLSLETVAASAGSYREEPREERRSFHGFDCDEAFALARQERDRHAGDYAAHAIPVLVVCWSGWSWRRTVALHALEGSVAILPPWSD